MGEVQNNWPAGIKRTRQRESVLAVLENSGKPLSAMDICSKMEKGADSAWLSTVYRILEVFTKKGVVKKMSIMNNEVSVYELSCSKHKHYAVCMNCHKMITIDNCPMEKFVPEFEEDFHVIGHNLDIYGFCKNCKPDDQ